jgi:hypothetical protein
MALEMWERPTAVSASSSWATPDTRNAQDGTHLRREAREALARGSHHAMSLHHMAAMWPTPAGSDAIGGRTLPDGTTPTGIQPDGRKAMVGLPNQVHWPTPRAAHDAGPHRGTADSLWQATRQWPTPQARDYRSPDDPNGPRATRKQAQGWSPNLNDVASDVASWPTPGARDYKAANIHTPAEGTTFKRDDLPGDLMRAGHRGKLNADWVEALQGFPIGWTSLASTAGVASGPPAQDNPNTTGSRRASRRRTRAALTAPRG